ncbi:conserved hypothetical protein [Stigmatella aurantiaca DW4/3-1]|uniref:Uncharacterized protein n=1 Tax=Stigmatella aurantiaca (strain DW4/3-1) TaxID=378806 RepID=Q093G7_STIAD|nr:conserved hypothetical protein [Stigmatella aurantiaca DW4/3-1]
MLHRHLEPCPFAPVPIAMRQAHHALHHLVRHHHRHGHLSRPRRHHGLVSLSQSRRLRILRVDHQRAARLARHQLGHVVHPRVVVPQVPPADQQQFALSWHHRPFQHLPQPLHVLHERRGRQEDAAVLRLQPSRQARLQRPQVHPVRRPPERRQAQAPAQPPRAHPIGPRAQSHLQDALRPQPPQRLERQLSPQAPALAQHLQPVLKRLEDPPVVHRPGPGVEQRGRVPGGVPHGEHVKHHVVLAPLQGRGGRQDEVRVPRRLVEVGVQAHHEVQRRQRLLQPSAVGRGEHRVARHRHQRADLALALGENLIGQRGHGQLPRELRQPPHPALPSAKGAPAHPHGPDPSHHIERGTGEQRPAHTVEVAAHDVQGVDEPLAQPAEGLGGHPHAPVTDRRLRAGEGLRHPANGLRGHPRGTRHPLRWEIRGQRAHRLQPLGHLLQTPQPGRLQHLMEHREQEQGIGARADEEVLVRDVRRLRPARIHHHHLPPTLLNGPEPCPHVWHRHQAAIGGQRVGAQHEQVLGVIQVRNGDEQLVAKHQVRGQVVRQLIHGGGAVLVARTQGAQEARHEEQHPHVVRARVAQVRGHRLPAVCPLRLVEPSRHLVQRLLPRDLLPSARGALHRVAQPVRVLVQVLERHRLGADVSPAERILGVPADGGDAASFHFDANPTHGLTKVACAEVSLCSGGGRHGPEPTPAHGLPEKRLESKLPYSSPPGVFHAVSIEQNPGSHRRAAVGGGVLTFQRARGTARRGPLRRRHAPSPRPGGRHARGSHRAGRRRAPHLAAPSERGRGVGRAPERGARRHGPQLPRRGLRCHGPQALRGRAVWRHHRGGRDRPGEHPRPGGPTARPLRERVPAHRLARRHPAHGAAGRHGDRPRRRT